MTILARAPLALAVGLASSLVAGLGARRAAGADVILDHLAPGTVKLDGKVKEWPGTNPGGEAVKPGKGTATFLAGYDGQGLWIGAEVAHPGGIAKGVDCVSLVVAFPREGVAKAGEGLEVHELGFYPGVPGDSAGEVRFRAGPLAGKAVDAARLVEANRAGGGYTLEAFVPWSAFGKRARVGLRGALRAYLPDGGVRATGPGDPGNPGALGGLLTEPEQSLPAALAAKKQSLRDVKFEALADVSGDGALERVLFLGRSIYVLGPGFKEGKQWLAVDLGLDASAVDVRDVTADGKADLLVTTRSKDGATTREALTVWAFSGDAPSRVFAHETAVESGANALRDLVAFGGGKKPSITITYDKPKGFTVDTYAEPIASDVDPILWPWGPVKERTFLWNGALFSRDKEVAQAALAPKPKGEGKGFEPTKPAEPLPPAGDLASLALKQYKKDKGLPADALARLEAAATVLPGKKGRAALYGRDLVVATGDGAYAVLGLGRFSSEKDIVELTARDLTGDGRDELIVRGMLRAKLTGGSDKTEREVLREVMLVYSPKPQGKGLALAPVFGAELGRTLGADYVNVDLRVVTAKGGTPGRIELMKGKAKGFSKASWPFAKEEPTPGLEPLLLPWGLEATIAYGWNGERFAR